MHALARRIFSKLKEISPSESQTNEVPPSISVDTQVPEMSLSPRIEKAGSANGYKDGQDQESVAGDEVSSQISPVKTASGKLGLLMFPSVRLKII
jgi:hypothetical protein